MNQMNLLIDILYIAGRWTADLSVHAGIHTPHLDKKTLLLI